MNQARPLSAEEFSHYREQGFLVLRQAAPAPRLGAMHSAAMHALQLLLGPVEYEADLGYPGAPENHNEAGGNTPRRLLHALSRGSELRQWGLCAPLPDYAAALLGGPVRLTQSHHNCIMTKHPGYSSATLWHQDLRYWSFQRPHLLNAWLALGEETQHNGGLQIIPGSHTLKLAPGQLDEQLFLKPELEQNAQLISQARHVHLNAGDLLLFDAGVFHAAGRNHTDQVKLSVVMTYHRADNLPLAGSRSARLPSLAPEQAALPGAPDANCCNAALKSGS